jgi:hypothetical protein
MRTSPRGVTSLPWVRKAECVWLIRDVLERQFALLEESCHWTRGALARTLLGESVVPLSDRAICWSLNGALARAMLDVLGPRAAQSDWVRLQNAMVDALWRSLPNDHPRTTRQMFDLDAFNDFVGVDHSDVQQLIRRAIEAIPVN